MTHPARVAANRGFGYWSTFGVHPDANGDIDLSGLQQFDDIDDFVAILRTGSAIQAVPEPSTIASLILAMFGLWCVRVRPLRMSS